MIEAELPDGRILEFPDGTDQSVIQAAVRRILGAQDQPTTFKPETGEVPDPEDPAFRGQMAGARELDTFEGSKSPQDSVLGSIKPLAGAALRAPSEIAAGVNRGVTNLADIALSPVDAALQISGSDKRIPNITQALSPATQGGYMEDDLLRRMTRTGSELIGPGLGMGSVFRYGAQSLPKFGVAAEGVGRGAIRQMGASTAAQDAGYSAVSGAGMEIGREIGGEPGAAIGGIFAPLAIATKGGLSGSIRALFAGDKKAATRTIDDFAAFGQSPTVGMASGKPGMQSAETVSGSVMGGGPLRRKSEQLADAMQKRLAQIADDLSTKEGAEEAGLQIQKGITGKGGFVDKFRSRSSVLWNKADGMIDESIPVDLANTKSKLDQLVQGGQIGDILDNPQLSRIKAVLDDVDNIDYDTMRKLRSSIGQKLSSNELISDIPRAELKQIYGALSDDIREIAQQSSGDALKAFKRANAYSRAGHERIDDHLTQLANKVNPDEVYRAIAKGGEGVKKINAVKRSVSPEDWEVVASNVVRRLGRATPGQQNIVGEEAAGDAFSVARFVTDWNKLGPARKALFSGSDKISQYGDDLAKIARSASVIKESSKQAANYSGTAQAASRIAAGTGLSTGILTASPTILGLTAGSVAMNNMGARLMTNPQFVKWLAQSAKIPASRSSAAIGGLVAAGKKSEADDAAAIFELVKELEEKNEP